MKKLVNIVIISILLMGIVISFLMSRPCVFVTDYGQDPSYSLDDRKQAGDVIKAEISTWEGFFFLYLSYEGIELVREESSGISEDTACLCFRSIFLSPWKKDKTNGFESFTLYSNWRFWLQKDSDGKWRIVDSGEG